MLMPDKWFLSIEEISIESKVSRRIEWKNSISYYNHIFLDVFSYSFYFLLIHILKRLTLNVLLIFLLNSNNTNYLIGLIARFFEFGY